GGDGTARFTLTEQHIGGAGNSPSITTYAPYNVTVTYFGQEQSQTATLTQSETLDFYFNGGNSADVNFDGRVNVMDLALVVYWQGHALPDADYTHLDVDGLGSIDWLDVLEVLLRI
ncbi:MAG: hypothetical protein KKB88_01990, partial [Nanoarchaeota archaeon]|nr:hypothetical protein [Nanoarchaeota archaeon]